MATREQRARGLNATAASWRRMSNRARSGRCRARGPITRKGVLATAIGLAPWLSTRRRGNSASNRLIDGIGVRTNSPLSIES
jgi:hypothetical protein